MKVPQTTMKAEPIHMPQAPQLRHHSPKKAPPAPHLALISVQAKWGSRQPSPEGLQVCAAGAAQPWPVGPWGALVAPQGQGDRLSVCPHGVCSLRGSWQQPHGPEGLLPACSPSLRVGEALVSSWCPQPPSHLLKIKNGEMSTVGRL